jgi:acyl-CoA hydrolase
VGFCVTISPGEFEASTSETKSVGTEGRTPAESAVTLGQQMLPDDANPSGDVHGGVVMKLVDTAAGLAAMRHARSRCVTAVMDSMTFEAPVHIGDLLHLDAHLTWTGRTSMEIEVLVEAENIIAGTRRRTSTAYLVYVALDAEGSPAPVPPLIVSSDQERAKWEAAERRRAVRLSNR